ncbi:DedA family protein, partial [Thioclava sp. BHET1]
MFRRLYNWTLAWAGSRHADKALGAVSFVESSVFPIPADVLFIPMCLARPDRAWRYALLATITSVLGGIFGWCLGH